MNHADQTFSLQNDETAGQIKFILHRKPYRLVSKSILLKEVPLCVCVCVCVCTHICTHVQPGRFQSLSFSALENAGFCERDFSLLAILVLQLSYTVGLEPSEAQNSELHSIVLKCIVLDKLIVTHLVKKLLTFYGTLRFITVFTRACQF